MITFLVITEGEPLIVGASEEAVADGRLAASLSEKGVDKFIAHETDVDRLRETYGVPFEVVEADITGGRDLCVLESRGDRAFSNVRFEDLGRSIQHES